MKVIAWLIFTLLGVGVLFFICGSTQMYPRDIAGWDTLVKVIFILGTIAWGIFVSYKINQND